MKLWYKQNPQLLENEINLMNQFQGFTLEKLDDGRLYWFGDIEIAIRDEVVRYSVMIVYENGHPYWKLGSSVTVYYIDPEIESLRPFTSLRLEDTPFHLCNQINTSVDQLHYNAIWIQDGDNCFQCDVPTSCSELKLHVAWLTIYEHFKLLNVEKFQWNVIEHKFPEITDKIHTILYGEI